MKWRDVADGDHWLLSPLLTAPAKKQVLELKARAPVTGSLLWILSSGTQSAGAVKAIGLSQSAILASAESVNRHLKSSPRDHWLLALPTYHVGGLGVLARATLSGAKVSRLPGAWDARAYWALVKKEWITLSSLVPAQVHDLVAAGLECPPSLRAVVIGGGALSVELYAAARRLRWPLLPSYGLSELASQVATAELSSVDGPAARGRSFDYPAFKILSHVEMDFRDKRIFLRGDSLCRFIATLDEAGTYTLEQPLRRGWFATEDLGEAAGPGFMRMLGRRDDIVKVLGELVSVPTVETRAQIFFAKAGLKGAVAVLAVADARSGHRLMLVTDSDDSLPRWQNAVTAFNDQCLGPERLVQLCWVPSIARAELGKIKKARLLKDLGF